jgi:hypothetical protein
MEAPTFKSRCQAIKEQILIKRAVNEKIHQSLMERIHKINKDCDNLDKRNKLLNKNLEDDNEKLDSLLEGYVEIRKTLIEVDKTKCLSDSCFIYLAN